MSVNFSGLTSPSIDEMTLIENGVEEK